MLRDALDAFVRRDTELAQHVLNEDDELDALKTQIFRELLTYMLQDPSTIEPALDLILISRHLERIGDHATNIAEDVIFIVSARDVRHHAGESRRPPEIDRDLPIAADFSDWQVSRMRPCRASRRRACSAGATRSIPAWRPFCSERCKLQDLARWADGSLPGAGEPVPDPKTTTDDLNADSRRQLTSYGRHADDRRQPHRQEVRAADSGRHDPRDGPAADQGRRPTTSG